MPSDRTPTDAPCVERHSTNEAADRRTPPGQLPITAQCVSRLAHSARPLSPEPDPALRRRPGVVRNRDPQVQVLGSDSDGGLRAVGPGRRASRLHGHRWTAAGAASWPYFAQAPPVLVLGAATRVKVICSPTPCHLGLKPHLLVLWRSQDILEFDGIRWEMVGDEKINGRISQWKNMGDQWIYWGYPVFIPERYPNIPKRYPLYILKRYPYFSGLTEILDILGYHWLSMNIFLGKTHR